MLKHLILQDKKRGNSGNKMRPRKWHSAARRKIAANKSTLVSSDKNIQKLVQTSKWKGMEIGNSPIWHLDLAVWSKMPFEVTHQRSTHQVSTFRCNSKNRWCTVWDRLNSTHTWILVEKSATTQYSNNSSISCWGLKAEDRDETKMHMKDAWNMHGSVWRYNKIRTSLGKESKIVGILFSHWRTGTRDTDQIKLQEPESKYRFGNWKMLRRLKRHDTCQEQNRYKTIQDEANYKECCGFRISQVT